MYGYPEFPNTSLQNYDMTELILMYKKLTDEYTDLLNDIAKLKNDLSDYENYVNNTIEPLVANANMQYLSKLTTIENNLLGLKARIANISIDIQNESKERKSTDCELAKKIQNLCATLCKWQTEYKSTLSQLAHHWEILLLDQKLYLMGRDAYYYNKVLDTLQDLQSQINDIPSDTKPVYNPVRDRVTTATDAIKDLYNYTVNEGGFNAEEWHEATYITCEYFKKSKISAIDFYIKGKYLLNWYYELNHVFSPVTGNYVTLQTAIYELSDCIRKESGITAGEYDEKNISASSYDNKNLKAYCYDWRGKELLEDV